MGWGGMGCSGMLEGERVQLRSLSGSMHTCVRRGGAPSHEPQHHFRAAVGGPRDIPFPEISLAPAAPANPRQKGRLRGQSPTVGPPRDDSVLPVMESLARGEPAAAPLPHQCPPPTCSAAELPPSPPPAWPRHSQGRHVLCYL